MLPARLATPIAPAALALCVVVVTLLAACTSSPSAGSGGASADASASDEGGDAAPHSDASADASSTPDASPPLDGASDALAATDASDGGACAVSAPGFYLAPGGSDSNACTLASPCRTFEKAQAMMAASSTIKTTYVRAGTYARAGAYTFADGESWLGYPCDPPHSATVDATNLSTGGPAFKCNSCSNVVLWNFTFVGAPTFDGGAWSDTNILLSAATNVHIDDNVFTGNLVSYSESDVYSFNGNDVYIRGNTFESATSGEPVSAPYTQAGTYAGLFITDNTFTGCQRFCVEGQIQLTTIAVSDLHIDRNTFTDFQGPSGSCGNGDHYIGAISAAGPPSASAEWATNATLWGNTLTLPSTNDNCVWGIEVGWTGTAVEYNTIAYTGVAMAIGGMPGTEIENNTLTLLASGSLQGGCAGGACAFIKDGGYNASEWIGANLINGSTVSGCVAPFCATGHGPYGTKPAVSTPSVAYAGAFP